jgi:hypothetical protein
MTTPIVAPAPIMLTPVAIADHDLWTVVHRRRRAVVSGRRLIVDSRRVNV